MTKLFEPAVRDRTIETTCSNLVMATVLRQEEIAGFMSELTSYTDVQLGITLIESRKLLENWLERCWSKN